MKKFVCRFGLIGLLFSLAACIGPGYYEALAPADQKELVQKVQEELIERGFDPGPADGAAGAKTLAALREFQKDRGLPATDGVDKVAFGQVLADTKHLQTGDQQTASADGKKKRYRFAFNKSKSDEDPAYNDSRVAVSSSCEGIYIPQIKDEMYEGFIPAFIMYAYNKSSNRYVVKYDYTYKVRKENMMIGRNDSVYTDEGQMTIRAGSLISKPLSKKNRSGGGGTVLEITKVDVFSCESS